MSDKVSIIIADSQYLTRLGLREVMGNEEKFHLTAEVTEEEQLLKELNDANDSIDVVILDYNQPDKFSPETIQKIKLHHPDINVLIISADNDKQRIYDVLENGVNNYLTKECDEEEIHDAIIAASRGERFFCTKVLDYIFEKSFRKNESCAPTPLSPRQIEIVQLIAEGKIAKEIAQELNLSTHTVYTHRKNIMKKLNVASTSELVLYAVRHDLIKSEVA